MLSFHFFDQLPSTNSWCLANTSRPKPFIVSTLKQTNGRGRRDNQWSSQLGDILLSYCYLSPLPICQISVLLGYYLVKQFRQFSPLIWLKWPNDILLIDNQDTTKIAGILIETLTQSNTYDIIIGIGVNSSEQNAKPFPLNTFCQGYNNSILWLGKQLHQFSQSLENLNISSRQLNEIHFLHQKNIYFDTDQTLSDDFLNINPNKSQRYQALVSSINSNGRLSINAHQSTISLPNAYRIEPHHD